MFNFFKKRNLPQEEPSLEVIFPAAEEMEKISSQKWKTLDDRDILNRITESAEKGNRHTYIFKAYISAKTYAELKQKGYKVNISSSDNEPTVKISW